MNNVYEMKLHEEIEVTKGLTIMRVPGGWNYIHFVESGEGWNVSSTFVHYRDPREMNTHMDGTLSLLNGVTE